jgi:hypothetical protein
MKRDAPEERPGRLYLSAVFERAKKLDLSPSKRLVLCALFRYLGDKDFCFPSQQSIAEDTRLNERTVRTLLKELAERGVIEITTRQTTRRKHGNHAYEYRFKIPHNDNQNENLEQNQTGNLRPSKRKPATTKPETHDRQTGNLRHSKVPDKQASHGRAGVEYVKNRSRKKSSNQSGKDGLTDTSSRKKTPAESSGLELSSDNDNVPVLNEEEGVFAPENMEEESFVPPPAAPPRLASEKIKALFGGPGPRLVDLLDCPDEDISLRDLTFPFKKGPEIIGVIGFDPDTPQAEWFEKALKEFFREVINRHWNRKAQPPGAPFRRLFYRAGRSGLLYEFGFRPLSPEHQEERRCELKRRKKEAVEVARIEEEELRRSARKNDKLKDFIYRNSEYFRMKRFSLENHPAIKTHLREIAHLGGKSSLSAVELFMKKEVRAARSAKLHRERIKELERLGEQDPRLIEAFVQKGIISKGDDWFFANHDACLDFLLSLGQEIQTSDLNDMAEYFMNDYQL